MPTKAPLLSFAKQKRVAHFTVNKITSHTYTITRYPL